MLYHRRSITRRLTTCTKICFSTLGCMWILGRVFIIMCRWSEEPAFGTCSGIVDHMCAEYSRNRLSGNLCLELCQNTSSDRFQCKHISGDGKKVILFTREGNQQVVLKTKTFQPPELQLDHQSLLKDTMAHESIATTELFLRHISRDLFLTNDTFNRFIEHLDINAHNAIAAVASGESLLSQEEYVTINNLQSTGIVPNVYGTCGNFYAVDYVPTDEVLLVNTFTAGWPWTSVGLWDKRRTVTIRLLELAERLDTHDRVMCDVKSDNFGWLEDGRAALLDADSLFTTRELEDILRNDSCWRDTDCSFWDCHGICNRAKGRCMPDITNTNFQNCCRYIDVGLSSGRIVVVRSGTEYHYLFRLRRYVRRYYVIILLTDFTEFWRMFQKNGGRGYHITWHIVATGSCQGGRVNTC